jgi:hypothetical protein
MSRGKKVVSENGTRPTTFNHSIFLDEGLGSETLHIRNERET